jgi:hypothetical protein
MTADMKTPQTPMETTMSEEQADGRMSFDEAVHYVQQQPDRAAFSSMPVFGERTDDEEQRAEGARVFVMQSDGAGSYCVHFVAGPFFANVFAANETMTPDDVPDRLKEVRFMPTRFDESWLTMQIQMLIQRLVQASGTEVPQMPDYTDAPAPSEPQAVPISFIGGRGTAGGNN